MNTELLNQIDALLAINAKGNATPRIPGLAVELLTRSAEALRRRSSDEQAAVVGWQVREKSTQWDDCEWTEWRQASDDFAQRLIRDGGKVDDFRIAEVRPVYASPPAVTEVTEEMVEAAAKVLVPVWYGGFEDQTQNDVGGGWLFPPGTPNKRARDTARAALTTALAVSEKK